MQSKKTSTKQKTDFRPHFHRNREIFSQQLTQGNLSWLEAAILILNNLIETIT